MGRWEAAVRTFPRSLRFLRIDIGRPLEGYVNNKWFDEWHSRCNRMIAYTWARTTGQAVTEIVNYGSVDEGDYLRKHIWNSTVVRPPLQKDVRNMRGVHDRV